MLIIMVISSKWERPQKNNKWKLPRRWPDLPVWSATTEDHRGCRGCDGEEDQEDGVQCLQSCLEYHRISYDVRHWDWDRPRMITSQPLSTFGHLAKINPITHLYLNNIRSDIQIRYLKSKYLLLVVQERPEPVPRVYGHRHGNSLHGWTGRHLGRLPPGLLLLVRRPTRVSSTLLTP